MRRIILCALALPLISACDIYLPSCGSDAIIASLESQSLTATGLEAFAEFGTITEISHDYKSRERQCSATVQPKAEFVARYNSAREQMQGSGGNFFDRLGKALVAATLPARIETTTVTYRILRDEHSGNFQAEISDEDLDNISGLRPQYGVAQLAIETFEGKKSSEPPATKETQGEI